LEPDKNPTPNNKNLKNSKLSSRISTVANNNKETTNTSAVFLTPFIETSFTSKSTVGVAG
jgi:hypothetical protein